ncbi:DUF6316 family protein [Alkalimarinus sediminis]|uniref:DUF6316 family protein n=1 Tax=Alkalimarinus sediminis TaxID=1632866 RepID=A0A9E8KPX6_9ALTE|nr:DUF6316 family protein [Alkalimarinus sediminis]UZW75773.1 DUF6316 family protein [Alkalimarinus sediminis]
MQVRKNEATKSWFRCDRFIQVGREWFYMTREGSQVGPFNSKTEAANDLYWYALFAQKGKFCGSGTAAREMSRIKGW